MDEFFASNPGLASRIAHHIDFPDYAPEELMEIAQRMLERQDYRLSPGAEQAFREYLERRMSMPRFAHGRSTRNAIDRVRLRHASRLFDDSAAGKTTMTRGLVRVLGEHTVTHACTDDYHRYDRKQRAELGITPLHPDCNYLDVMAQDLRHLRDGEAILKPVYRHADGTFTPPVYVQPHGFAIVEGLLGYHSPQMRDCYDVRVFLAPPED